MFKISTFLVLGGCILFSFSLRAQEQEADIDPLFGDVEKVDLESDGHGAKMSVRPTEVKTIVIDNAAKKRAAIQRAQEQKQQVKKQEKKDPEEKKDNVKDASQKEDDEIVVPQSAIGIPSVMQGDAAKGEKPLSVLEKYRTERAKAKIKNSGEPIVSSDEMNKRQAEAYKGAKEERRKMTREESRQQQLELRQLYKERIEERRRIRKLPRSEQHKLQQQLRDAEKERRQKYIEAKEKRREMRKLNSR